jgi:hypothetical protein
LSLLKRYAMQFSVCANLRIVRRLQPLPEFQILLAFRHQTTSIDVLSVVLLTNTLEMHVDLAKGGMVEFAIW